MNRSGRLGKCRVRAPHKPGDCAVEAGQRQREPRRRLPGTAHRRRPARGDRRVRGGRHGRHVASKWRPACGCSPPPGTPRDRSPSNSPAPTGAPSSPANPPPRPDRPPPHRQQRGRRRRPGRMQPYAAAARWPPCATPTPSPLRTHLPAADRRHRRIRGLPLRSRARPRPHPQPPDPPGHITDPVGQVGGARPALRPTTGREGALLRRAPTARQGRAGQGPAGRSGAGGQVMTAPTRCGCRHPTTGVVSECE